MEESKQNIINIGEQEEIIDIINKIKNVPGKTVTLVIPKGAVILQDVINLKILHRKAVEMGKEISLSKNGVADLYQETVRMPAAPAAPAAIARPVKRVARFTNKASGSNMVSDMVRKNETVDLRKINVDEREESFAAKEISDIKPKMETPHFAEDVKDADTVALPQNMPFRKIERKDDDVDYFARLNKRKGGNRDAFETSLPVETETEPEEKNVRRIEREELFGDRKESEPVVEKGKEFDFSYGHGEKKKRASILPTISAKFFAIFILICVLTASLSLFFILPKADIVVALKQEDTQGDFTFILDKDLTENDAAAGKIPARNEEIISEKAQGFTATGKKTVTTKASGELTILNECTTSEQLLVAGTRFLSKTSGKIFKIESTAVIPGYTQPDDEVLPGSVTVKVTAENDGDTYNIAADAFTIPKLQESGSKKYGCLYGRSDKAMAGGSSKDVAVILQNDIDSAKEALTLQAKEEITSKSSQQKSEDLIYIDDMSNEGEITVKCAAKANDVADKFDMTVSIKKTLLTIEKRDLETILADKLKASGDFENAKAVEGSLSYQLGDTIENDEQTSISVSAAQSYGIELNIDELKKAVAGKDEQELNDYFLKVNGVKSVSVKPWPFWVKKVPKSLDKIFITLQ